MAFVGFRSWRCEDGPFEPGTRAALEACPAGRRSLDAGLDEIEASAREMAAQMGAYLAGPREAFRVKCDLAPPSPEVAFLRSVADETWAAIQSVNRAAAESYRREAEALVRSARRWLDEGGVWEHATGELPCWRNPAGESPTGHVLVLAPPLPARLRPVFFRLACWVRDIARRSGGMLADTKARHYRSDVVEGVFYEAHDAVYESHLLTAQSAQARMSEQLEEKTEEIAQAAQRWWRGGGWNPPEKPRLLNGAFWAHDDFRHTHSADAHLHKIPDRPGTQQKRLPARQVYE